MNDPLFSILTLLVVITISFFLGRAWRKGPEITPDDRTRGIAVSALDLPEGTYKILGNVPDFTYRLFILKNIEHPNYWLVADDVESPTLMSVANIKVERLPGRRKKLVAVE